MRQEISRKGREAARPFALAVNAAARLDAPWTERQNNILNDAAFAHAKATISAWRGYAPTPLVSLSGLAAEAGVAAIDYKDEAGRFGLGSFKALGGAYAVARLLCRELTARLDRPVSMTEITGRKLIEETAKITVCCATDGNHGRSVAWGAQSFGCRCVIFIHQTVSEGRKAAIERFGAEVRRCSGNYDDSIREAQELATRAGWFVVSDTSYPGYTEIPKDVMQGYELMAAEAFEQIAQPPTHIFLQTGVGGMAAAIAAKAKRRWGSHRPMIVLVDPERAGCWLRSYGAGRPTAADGDLDTLMAGLACGEVSVLAWEVLKDHGDAAMAVPDATAIELMRRLARPKAGDPPLVAGESAVAGLGGLLAAMVDEEAKAALGLGPGARALIFGTEGDTDPALYAELVGAGAATVRSSGA